MALRGAVSFALRREAIRWVLASPVPIGRAHQRRNFGSGFWDAATLDGIAAEGDDISPVDGPLVSRRCGDWNCWRVFDGGVFDAAELWRLIDGASYGVDSDDGNCVGGDFEGTRCDAQGVDDAVVYRGVRFRDIPDYDGPAAGRDGAAGIECRRCVHQRRVDLLGGAAGVV